jgi:hypothetical protein
LSFLSLAEAIASGAGRVDQARLEAELVEQVGQPAPAVGGLEGDRRPRVELAQNRNQLGWVVGEVAVEQLRATRVQHRDLRALAVHVHADVDLHVGLLPRAATHSERRAPLSRGEARPT